MDLAELIVTTVIRDAMLAAFHSRLVAPIRPSRARVVINWLPDRRHKLTPRSGCTTSIVFHRGAGCVEQHSSIRAN